MDLERALYASPLTPAEDFSSFPTDQAYLDSMVHPRILCQSIPSPDGLEPSSRETLCEACRVQALLSQYHPKPTPRGEIRIARDLLRSCSLPQTRAIKSDPLSVPYVINTIKARSAKSKSHDSKVLLLNRYSINFS